MLSANGAHTSAGLCVRDGIRMWLREAVRHQTYLRLRYHRSWESVGGWSAATVLVVCFQAFCPNRLVAREMQLPRARLPVGTALRRSVTVRLPSEPERVVP